MKESKETNCSRDMGKAQFLWFRRLKVFRKFLGQADVVVFVRWERRERIPYTRRLSAQLASSVSFRDLFFLHTRLCLGERPRKTWREARAGGLPAQRSMLMMLLFGSLPSLPLLEPPYPRVGVGEIEGGRGRGAGRRESNDSCSK